MLDIIPHIQYLLLRKDCVVLPGWGAFITNRVNAYVADGVMYPPSRTLAFNPSLNHDDGDLTASVARRCGVRFEAAKASVTASIEQLRRLYNIVGYVTFPRIGTLSRDENGMTIFTPAEDSIASVSYMALPAVTLENYQPVAVQAGAEVAKLSGIRKFGRIAAAVAVLIGLGITLSTPVLVDREKTDLAAIPAPEITPAKTISLPANAETVTAPAGQQVLYIPTPSPELTTETAASFYIIVSSHSSAAEANKFIETHPGRNLTVFESDNRFRIVAASAHTYNEALKIKSEAEISSRYPDAWILKK
ncbi:MAG: hypothetical protein K2H84_01710 [Paramuribaculum sp.]|nr:hypothetical protein [Paramuribaculum sp.]